MLEKIGLWFQKNPETILLGLGVLFLLVAAAMLVNPVRLVMHGKVADAVVTDVVERIVRDQQGNNRSEFTATIHFRAGEQNIGIQHSQSRGGRSFCFSGCYSKGERLKVRYHVDDPEIARVASFWGLFGLPFLFGLFGAMGIFFWKLWRGESFANA